MIWLLVAQLAAPIIGSGARLDPADAARILASSPGMSNRTHARTPLPDGPKIIMIRSNASDGPFGAFPRYVLSRLPNWGGDSGYSVSWSTPQAIGTPAGKR